MQSYFHAFDIDLRQRVKMKLLVLAALAFMATVVAAPPPESVTEAAKLLDSQFRKEADGSYDFSYKIDNGNERSESGTPKEVKSSEDEKLTQTVVVVRGTYTQNDDEGKPHVFTYEADENGYRVVGDLVPKA